ncbi:DUF3017 domain-containing protein [Corynebacterium sp. Marseille-P4321]|uniref:DUF3017 domain-containing protein n=1 Tax=Corynebacterium sp. Marseille-P4321 TaxID=2736603 RepID=UPI00089376E6|nr:DUF3017 domain-containing protein [Corynebacterium sp. Marseille-P4321]OEY13386.1 hypothetical protein A0K93_05265 [Corynebacterium sp. BCW_4722]
MAGLTLDNPHDRGNRPSPLPLWAQWAMVALLVAGVLASGVFAATEHWRRATFTLGAAMVWLAFMRVCCDSKVIGLVAVRSKRFDALFCTFLGAGMMWLAWSVDSLGS